jgi:hypothetical protein
MFAEQGSAATVTFFLADQGLQLHYFIVVLKLALPVVERS